MNQPKVSVIIPVYNTEKYLRECLDSIVDQTLKDIEIICVDDGSSDGSPCILEEYRAKDPRVVVITQANLGPSSARNSGMNRAHGEYIAFVDSDDYLELNTLESVSRIAAEKHLDVILFDVEPFYESEQLAQNPPVHYKNISESTEIMSGVQYLKTSKDKGTYYMTVWSALWRRAYFKEHVIVFKDGIIHEDVLFNFQAYMAARRVMRIPYRLYHRRVRENSIMTSPKSAKNIIGYFSCAMGVLNYALNHESDPMEAQEIKREYIQRLDAARRIYKAVSDEEKERICFSSETENELFQQLIKNRVRLEAANEQQKQRAERLQEALDNKKKESDTLLRDLEQQKQRAERLQNALDNKEKEFDTLRRDLEKQKKRADTLQYDLDCVHDSVSFRVGRGMTYLPRKLRDLYTGDAKTKTGK